MADQADAEILQIVGRQVRQYRCIDLVRAEGWLVLLEPEPPQPFRDIHCRNALVIWAAIVSYAFSGIATEEIPRRASASASGAIGTRVARMR